MNREELLETDQYYKDNIDNWLYLESAYKGAKALVEYGILEGLFKSPEQYLVNGAVYGFNYTRRINEILTGFILNSNFISDFDTIADDTLFKMFMSDCDLSGTDFDIWLNERREVVSCMGHIGVLVDMPNVTDSPQYLIDNKIYPYLSSYSPVNILEMQRERDKLTNRPKFVKIKLREYSPDRIIIFTPEQIQIFQIPENDDEDEAVQINAGNDTNNLGEIPFFLFVNNKIPGTWNTQSNVRGIADIDVSLIKDGIKGEKILFNAAFPNLIKPADIDDPNIPEQEVKTGVYQIFNETPETRGIHRWISSEAWSAMQPILASMDDKRREIYLMANLGAILQSTSNDARSGESLKESFRYLIGNLSKMVSNELEARRNIFRLWLLWLGRADEFEKISLSHDGDFNIESLITSIDDVISENALLIASPTAQSELSKKIVSIGSLKTIDMRTRNIIFSEIDKSHSSISEKIILPGQ